MTKQLTELARRFPASLVKKAPQGKYGDYVPHSIVNERLLEVLGPFDFQLVQVIRGHAPELKTKTTTYPARADAIVGVVARMTATIDGRSVTVEEVGTEDNPAMKTDAENLKNSMSDALKRCAMRFGLGLHLWSQRDYYLDRALAKADKPLPPSMPHDDKPVEATVDTIGKAGADKLIKYLAKARAGDPYAFAKLITGREVEALEDLTRDEANEVWQAARDAVKEEEEAA